MGESRRHRRIAVAIRVFARDRSAFPEDTRDISSGGFCVETREPLPRGTESDFSIWVPHHEVPLEIRGEVVWTRVGGMGVRITRNDERFESYVERLIKDSERI